MPKPVSPEEMNARREQQVLNARLTALTAVVQVHQGIGTPMDRIFAEVERTVTFLIGDIDALKPKSSLILQANMPPEGAFKPGD